MDTDDVARMARVAERARANAYAPYSGFKVGAAALAADGRIFAGANVENASYGVTLCAERAAVAAAVAEGAVVVAVLVLSETGGSPCGTCRQFLYELGAEMKVLWGDGRGEWRQATTRELLPSPFRFPPGK